MTLSAGERLRAAVAAEKPLQVVGAVNAYTALLAERSQARRRKRQQLHRGCSG